MRALVPTVLLAAALLASPAWAEEPVTAAEFEALVEGRTLTYGTDGAGPYGIEHYFPGRRVAWAWVGTQECMAGEWYAEGPKDDPAICFAYDGDPEPKCWRFTRLGDRLRADYLGDGGATVLYEIVEEAGALVCGGAGV